MSKEKILILSQLGWPPEFGARILSLSKITKYLPKHGIFPVIVAPPPHSKSMKDEELCKDILKYGGTVEYVGRQIPPYWNRSRISKGLKIFFIPDLRFYYTAYLKNVLKIIEKYNMCYISTSTPPSGLIIGYMIKKRIRDKIKWIADFADPWTLNHFYFAPTPLHRRFDENLERKVVENADALTFASEFQMKNYVEKYPFIKNKVYWRPNGYDEEDFEGIEPFKFDKFTFLHMGSIYREFDLSFLKIFKKLEEKYNFQLLFVGNIAPKKLEEIKSKKMKSVKILGRLTHKETIRYLLSADALIFNMKYDYTDVLPSRLPEYLRAKKPILAFTSHNSFVSHIISKCNSGFIIEKSEFDKGYKIVETLIKHDIKINPNEKEIENFNWKNISGKLARIMEGLKNA